MPLKFWWNAFSTIVFIINRLPTQVLSHKSPYEMIYGHHPNFRFLKVFGCACFPFLRPYNHNKLQFRSAKCVFIGYSSKHKGYLCLHPSGRVYVAYDMLFNEEEFPFSTTDFHSNSSPSNNSPSLSLSNPNSQPIIFPTNFWPVSSKVPSTCSSYTAPSSIQSSSGHSCPSLAPISPHDSYNSTNPTNSFSPVTMSHSPHVSHSPHGFDSLITYSSMSTSHVPVNTSSTYTIPPILALHRPCPESTHAMTTRSKTGVFKPKCVTVSISQEPDSVAAALLDSNWKQAMADEYSVLIRNNTWTPVPFTKGMNVVDNKWVFLLKYNVDGSVQRYKARLSAKGFQ